MKTDTRGSDGGLLKDRTIIGVIPNFLLGYPVLSTCFSNRATLRQKDE